MFHNSCSLKTVLADVNWGLKCWFNTVKSVSQRPLWGSRGFRCEKLSLDFINASRSRYHSLCSAEHIYYILFQCWFPLCKKGQWQNRIIQKRTHVRKSGVWKVCFMRNKGSRYNFFFKESKLSSWNYQNNLREATCFWLFPVKVTQLCPILWSHGLYSPWNSLGQNTGVGSLSLLQGIFPTQGSNPGLLHCRQSLPAEPQGKPKSKIKNGVEVSEKQIWGLLGGPVVKTLCFHCRGMGLIPGLGT